MRGTAILLNNNYQPQIAPVRDATTGKIISGLIIGDTLYQNQALILGLYPGEIKESPVLGVGLADALLDNDFLAWRQRIRQHMELDGQTVNSVLFTTATDLTIDAAYATDSNS